ncbi:hypothetical protein B0H10DRAFT_2209804 [Mycena sp. CBHHK59/15]|nr:hypothetical protein B0H10DRAFT_2209804 [Mycena sp. CBHHK59/15]
MSLKEVRWASTVDVYEAAETPESWTSPLPGSPPSPLPMTPHPAYVPLPGTLQVHPVLSPEHCLRLDFSMPSEAFDGNPQLTHDLLDEHACSTSATQLVVRISAGLIHMDLEVLHKPPGQSVTVGDVLTRLHRYLRERERDLPPVTVPYTNRRAETVNGYCEGRPLHFKAANIARELACGSKRVDRLLGYTSFGGLFVRPGKPENFWQLDLAIPQRYAT